METPSIQDYEDAIRAGGKLIKSSQLKAGHAKELPRGGYVKYSGGFCVVFPYIKSDGRQCALRCWTSSVSDTKARSQAIAKKLAELDLPYFVSFEYEENGIVAKGAVQPVVIMDWVEADTLKDYVGKHLNEPEQLVRLAMNFKSMCKILHCNGISHGDLQHGNIMVRDNGDLVLVDYDSMYVPELDGYKDEIHGLRGYQHPARFNNTVLTPKADYFSELVIYTSLLALSQHKEWWQKFKMEHTETFLFSEDDINHPSSSDTIRLLKNDKNEELRHLGEAVEKALRENDLTRLKKLEDATVSELDIFAATIGDFINNRPKTSVIPFEVHDNLDFSSDLDSFLGSRDKH